MIVPHIGINIFYPGNREEAQANKKGYCPRKGREMRKSLLASLIVGVLAYVTPNAAPLDDEWTRYTNDRFGASAEIPRNGFSALETPSNNDGRTWISADQSATQSIYGSFYSPVDTWSEYRSLIAGYLLADGLTIVKEEGEDDWFLFIGKKGADFSYMKVVKSPYCMAANHIVVKYPQSETAMYASLSERVAASLSSKKGYNCGL